MRIKAAVAAAAVIPLLVLAGCSSGAKAGESGAVTLTYRLWDSLQQPAYEECAAAFHKANPNITVKITQTGWEDYWTTLQADFVAGTAPDVFTDHVTWFPQFASQGQILDLSDKIKADNLDMSIYQDKLVDVWTGQKGEQYGLPKDWDTIGLVYNADMMKDAGYTADDLAKLDWNPQDGGSFEKLVAHLTVDENGVRGDEPGFDKTKIKTYGYGLNGSGGAFGQSEYSEFAVSDGWKYVNKNPWGDEFYYSDPKLKETLGWLRSFVEKGYSPTLEIIKSSSGMLDPLSAGKYAMAADGDWNANSYASAKGLKVGFAPTPIGPTGKRASMFNGLADSIWAGSKHPDEAWKWVKFLGSADCQDLVAAHAVVFPAIKTSTDKAFEAFKAKGMDLSGFLVQVQDGTTFIPPIADHWGDVQTTMTEATDSIFSLKSDVDVLDKANEKVNALFK
ncbi:ABC transporter substrate-binding protein [Xylanimonas sp. McL0601]|uniref:ABC transporter substrate-binding protein n=1 Tax=Xylanimonas sp. McL0601 TaxID=3414739 RepID=UPI003CE92BB9